MPHSHAPFCPKSECFLGDFSGQVFWIKANDFPFSFWCTALDRAGPSTTQLSHFQKPLDIFLPESLSEWLAEEGPSWAPLPFFGSKLVQAFILSPLYLCLSLFIWFTSLFRVVRTTWDCSAEASDFLFLLCYYYSNTSNWQAFNKLQGHFLPYTWQRLWYE